MTQPLLSLPEIAKVANVVMTLTRTTGISQSPFTREEQAFKWPGEFWSVSFNIPPVTKRSDASEWMAFGAKLEGTYGHFLMGDPAHKLPSGNVSGTIQVDGAGQTGNTLLTKGWSGNLKKGDYFQLGTGASSRIYMLTDDTDSDESPGPYLTFVPALRSSPLNEQEVIVNNPVGVFRSVDDSFSWSVEPGPVYRFSFQAVEVVNA